MRDIRVLDTTLRDGEQAPGFSMNLKEKLEIAKQLERLRVDVIEAGFPFASGDDYLAVTLVAQEIRDCQVAGLARARASDVNSAWSALKGAASPMLNIFIATSDLHLEHKLHMTREQVLDVVAQSVKHAKTLFPFVEFSAEDALRSDREYLCRVMEAAVAAGADVINIADTVGYATGNEMYDICRFLLDNVAGLGDRPLAVHCHNDLGQAVANSLTAITAGASQVECTINGIGERAGNASLEEFVMALKVRRDVYDADTRINSQEIYRTSRLLRTVTGIAIPPNKAIVGRNVFAHESGIHQHGVMNNPLTYEIMTPESVGVPGTTLMLGKHSGRHAFDDKLRDLGYALSDAELDEAFTRFKSLADRKKNITDQDLVALVGAGSIAIPEIFSLGNFVVNSGSNISATAVVQLYKEDEKIETVAMGSGPIDAAFSAIANVSGVDYALENYAIQSVTEGEDALGEVSVTLQKDGHFVTGRGLSTDIIEASIKAYLNAINKILIE